MNQRLRAAARRCVALTFGLMMAHGAFAQDLDLTPLAEGETVQVKIGVGGTASPTQLGIWIAQYGGFFEPLEEEGIQVELVPFGGGSDAMLALVGGQTDMSYQFLENAIRARAQGRDVHAIYNALPVPALGVTVRKELEDEIKSVADAKERRWGFTSFGSGSHVVSLRVATHHGLDPAYVSWTPVGGVRGYLPSMREDRVDLLTSGVEAANTLVQEGTAFMLVDLTDPETVQEIYGYPYISIALLTTEQFTDENPYVTFKIVEALDKAIDHIKSTPASEIAALLPAEFQGPALEMSIEQLAAAHSDTGLIDLEVVEKMIKDIEDLNVASAESFSAEDLVDNRFVEALQEQGAGATGKAGSETGQETTGTNR
jgi:NitT/TauT family transport system substrate-binding protein